MTNLEQIPEKAIPHVPDKEYAQLIKQNVGTEVGRGLGMPCQTGLTVKSSGDNVSQHPS